MLNELSLDFVVVFYVSNYRGGESTCLGGVAMHWEEVVWAEDVCPRNILL